MRYTFDDNVISDLHKDIYGFRPSQDFWQEWRNATADQKQKIWDDLLYNLREAVKREQEQEQESITSFEALVMKNIESGALNRETALRWIMMASDCDGDWEYLCYTHGLPMRYLSKQ